LYGNKPAIAILILVALAIILPPQHYDTQVYPITIANGYFDRAVASGFAEGMIEYSRKALALLEPYKGNPAWIFPTPRTDFDLIKRDIETCIARLEELSKLPRETDAYQQGLDDVRGKIEVIKENLRVAGLWVMIPLVNIIYFILWLTALIITSYIWLS